MLIVRPLWSSPMSKHPGTCQDTGQLPDLTINDLPAEVLLETFNLYRQSLYDYQWTEKICMDQSHTCVQEMAHCRVCVPLPPEFMYRHRAPKTEPCPFHILIDYKYINKDIDRYLTNNPPALRRLHAALKHPDRVRGITFEGTSAGFDKLFEVTNRPFPMLESLSLSPEHRYDLKLPDTFLRGPDLRDLHHLRRLKLCSCTLPPICGFLSSTSALTDLDLVIQSTNGTSQEKSLLACLQGMPCLRSINMRISHKKVHDFESFKSSHPSTSKVIFPLSKLTSFCFSGHSFFLNFLMAGFSAPSLRNVNISFRDVIWNPIVHLPRFMNAIEVHYHTAYVAFQGSKFSVSLVPDSGFLGAPRPRFELGSRVTPPGPGGLIIQMCSALSTTLSTINELYVIFDHMADLWEDYIPWRRLLQHFPGVKTLRTRGANSHYVARTLLHQDHEEPDDVLSFLPVLEEIELDKYVLSTLESQRASQLAVPHVEIELAPAIFP